MRNRGAKNDTDRVPDEGMGAGGPREGGGELKWNAGMHVQWWGAGVVKKLSRQRAKGYIKKGLK